jgi:hypothetical protein
MPPMRVPFLASLLGSLAAFVPAQTLAELTATLAQKETVDDEAVGDGGDKSDTYRTYERWRALATAKELRQFTTHPSPVVRAYAAKALVDIEADADWTAILRERLLDTSEVTTFVGCCLSKEYVGDVVFTTLRPRLTAEQLQEVAEDLVTRKSPLAAREWVLRTQRLRDGMLHTVRALVHAGDAPAAIALARYGLPTDAPLLAKLLQHDDPFGDNAWFVAAEIHHDPSLLAPLVALEAKATRRLETDNPSRLQSWLRAIAAQRSAEAGAFLARFLRATTPTDTWKEKDLLQTCKQAVTDHPDCGAFDEVRQELRRRIEASRTK